MVAEVVRKDAAQMFFVQHDDVVEALPTYRADDPFAIRVLPGRAWCYIVTSSIPMFFKRFLK